MTEGYDHGILSKEEASAMTPADDVIPGQFNATFKDQKQYEQSPRERVIAVQEHSWKTLQSM